MVTAVQRGQAQRAVARRYGFSLATVQYPVRRARGQRLDRVDRTDRLHAPRRSDAAIEGLALSLCREPAETSDRGSFGAEVIHRALS